MCNTNVADSEAAHCDMYITHIIHSEPSQYGMVTLLVSAIYLSDSEAAQCDTVDWLYC